MVARGGSALVNLTRITGNSGARHLHRVTADPASVAPVTTRRSAHNERCPSGSALPIRLLVRHFLGLICCASNRCIYSDTEVVPELLIRWHDNPISVDSRGSFRSGNCGRIPALRFRPIALSCYVGNDWPSGYVGARLLGGLQLARAASKKRQASAKRFGNRCIWGCQFLSRDSYPKCHTSAELVREQLCQATSNR